MRTVVRGRFGAMSIFLRTASAILPGISSSGHAQRNTV